MFSSVAMMITTEAAEVGHLASETAEEGYGT